MNKIVKTGLVASIAAISTVAYSSFKIAKKLVEREYTGFKEVKIKDYENVYIINKENEQLAGYLCKRNPRQIMLFVHPFLVEGIDMMSYCDFFASKLDCSFLIIDLYGHGNSDGRRMSYGKENSDDLICWLEYLEELGYEDMILYGKELGANVVISALPYIQTMKVSTVISDGAFSDIKTAFKEKGYYESDVPMLTISSFVRLFFKYKYHTSFDIFYPIDALKNNKIPVLYIQSMNDPYTSSKNVYPLFNATTSSKELVLLKDESYLYMLKNDHPYYDVMMDFIESHKRP